MNDELVKINDKYLKAMDIFILAKLKKDRANREFEIAQREVTYLEAELREIKWEQLVV